MQDCARDLKHEVGRVVLDVLHRALGRRSKLHTHLKIAGSLTWCLMCFPKKAITYFNPEVYEMYALRVSLLYTLICFSLEWTN